MGMPSVKQTRDYNYTAEQQVPSDSLRAIDHLLEQLYGERMALIASIFDTSALHVKSGRSPDQASRTISDLDRSIERLENIKTWLAEDRQLLALVDEAIGQHMRQMERRTHRFDVQLALTTSIGGALLGWLLATVSSPQDLL